MSTSRHSWVVVLAAGEGTRLSPLTRALYGHDLPKQYAVLAGERSLLQQTVERALEVAYEDHVVVVASSQYAGLAREQLAEWPSIEVIAQPSNLDTGPGLLLPVAHVRARDAEAHVVIMPADHYIPNEQPLVDALRSLATDPTHRSRVTLLGVVPTQSEPEYGFVVPHEHDEPVGSVPVRSVRGFFEKPAADVAERLRDGGALWNTFISAGVVDAFWSLARAHVPDVVERFERYLPHVGHPSERAARLVAYAGMRRANFSKDVFENARELQVARIEGTGWTDWGSPRRVFESLSGTPELRQLQARMRSANPAAAFEVEATG